MQRLTKSSASASQKLLNVPVTKEREHYLADRFHKTNVKKLASDSISKYKI